MPVYPLNGQSIYSAEVWMEATSMSQCLRTCEENACGTQQIMCFILRQMGWEWLATSSNALSLSAVALRRAREPCHRCFFHKLLWVNDIVQKNGSLLFFPSLEETKYAHNLGQMLSRKDLHLSHNSIKDCGIYKVDF